MTAVKPDHLAKVHRSICRESNCSFLDKLDYFDPCAACPNGHWPQYDPIRCDDLNNESKPSPNYDKLRDLRAHPGDGPGTELKKLLSRFGFKPAVGCKCAQHITEMNANGVTWCLENIPTIIGWLKEEAARAKLPFVEIGAKLLIKRAIRNAEKKLPI